MIRRLLLSLSLIFILDVTATAQRRVLLVSIDGLDTRYLRDADKLGLKIPHLRQLMRDGVRAQGVISVHPSVTYPNHTSAVTGAYPAQHGIPGNVLFEPPERERTGAAYWYTRSIKTDTIWDAAKRKGLRVGLVCWPVAGGAGDWNVPETWSEGRNSDQIRVAMRKESRPQGLVEEVERAMPDLYAKETKHEGDDHRARFAEYIVEKNKPDLMLLHIYDLDHFEHDFGPFTPKAIAVLEKSDANLGRVLAAYRRAGILKETAVIVMSDHGFLPYTRIFHPAVLLAKEGLIEMETQPTEKEPRYTVKSWRAFPYLTGASCGIMLRDPKDTEAVAKALSIFQPLAGEVDSPIFRIVLPGELKEMGADLGAAFYLEAAQGYSCGPRLGPDFITENSTRGNHGYLPSRPEFMASFVASGAGVKRRGEIGILRMVDIGPTIAQLLGLELRDAVGIAAELQSR